MAWRSASHTPTLCWMKPEPVPDDIARLVALRALAEDSESWLSSSLHTAAEKTAPMRHEASERSRAMFMAALGKHPLHLVEELPVEESETESGGHSRKASITTALAVLAAVGAGAAYYRKHRNATWEWDDDLGTFDSSLIKDDLADVRRTTREGAEEVSASVKRAGATTRTAAGD